MFPTFTNLALLGGLAAVTAPILIHLLLRRKSQRMRFSTIQFFLKQDEQSMRKRKLRNLLLLATRVLLFALIALAFARPFLPDRASTAVEARRQLILVLDTSASMQAVGPNGPQWDRALDAARKELSSLKMNDRAALIASSTRSETLSEFAPASVIQARLDELKPGFGKAQLEEGLRQAFKVQAAANPKEKIEIVMISDLQRSGSENLSSAPLPPEVAVRFIDLGERYIPNTAVTALQLESTEVGPHALVTSYSDEPFRGGYRLLIDGKEALAGTLALEPGTITNLSLAVPALAPGWHSAEFALDTRDALKADDIAYSTTYVPQPIHGLVVEPRTVGQIFLEETYFVSTALNPVRDAAQISSSRFSYTRTNLEKLAADLKPEPGQPRPEFLVLPAVKTLSTESAGVIQNFVQAGGGLILFLGPGTSAISLARLGDLLPAHIGKVESVGESENGWHLAKFDGNSTVFASFAGPLSGNLTLPKYTQRCLVTANPGSTVLASFADGVPLVIVKQLGAGRVVLVNSSADTSWTDWQKYKSFVPWLHATARYATHRDQSHEREPSPQWVAGSELALDVKDSNELKKTMLKLQRVGGSEISFATDDDGLVQELLLETPGIYLLKDNSGREIRRLAANLPSAESDLTTAAPSELEQQLVRTAAPEQQVLTASLLGDSSSKKELWRLLLLAAASLLLIEPILANRMFA